MPREWSSPIEAKAKGSLCNFQFPGLPTIPIFIPAFALPDFPPELPTINLVCPFDEADEEVPKT